MSPHWHPSPELIAAVGSFIGSTAAAYFSARSKDHSKKAEQTSEILTNRFDKMQSVCLYPECGYRDGARKNPRDV